MGPRFPFLLTPTPSPAPPPSPWPPLSKASPPPPGRARESCKDASPRWKIPSRPSCSAGLGPRGEFGSGGWVKILENPSNPEPAARLGCGIGAREWGLSEGRARSSQPGLTDPDPGLVPPSPDPLTPSPSSILSTPHRAQILPLLPKS